MKCVKLSPLAFLVQVCFSEQIVQQLPPLCSPGCCPAAAPVPTIRIIVSTFLATCAIIGRRFDLKIAQSLRAKEAEKREMAKWEEEQQEQELEEQPRWKQLWNAQRGLSSWAKSTN